jgi:hypothetical protein
MVGNLQFKKNEENVRKTDHPQWDNALMQYQNSLILLCESSGCHEAVAPIVRLADFHFDMKSQFGRLDF